MKCNRRACLVCGIALAVLAVPSVSVLLASAAEFKATVSYRTPEKTESVPISMKGLKSRMDRMVDGRETVIIVDQERGTVLALDVAERKYGQFPLVSVQAGFLLSLPSIIRATAAQPGMETKPLGTETVSGYSCEKFAIVDKGDPTFSFLTYWVSQKLQYPLKIVYEPKGDRVIEVTKIQEGPVEDSLFQVPPGYTLAAAPAAPPVENPAPPPMPDLPAWVQEVPSAPCVNPPHQQRIAAGEIIRVKVEADQKIVVGTQGEGGETALFTAFPFSGGKPLPNVILGETEDPSKAFSDRITYQDFYWTPEEANEIVVRVHQGVVLIEVKQEPAN